MLTDVDGVRVGHWTDHDARTGCTVVLLPAASVASGEVRGASPATREFDLLHPLARVEHVHAVLLTGGSAFGLAAADGVVAHLAAVGTGFPTPAGPVPIVVALALYDLGVGDGGVRPGVVEGRAAAAAAEGGRHAIGSIGAGTGATTSKWSGRAAMRPGGLGTATYRAGDLVVSALIAVNAYGAIDDGSTLADPGPPRREAADLRTNTTIGVIATNARLDKRGCHLVAQSGHDGMARALLPAHTEADGDALVAVATGAVDADPFHVRLLAQHAVTAAIRSVGGVR